MKLLKKLIAVLALVPALALADEGGFPLDQAPDRITDLASLQNGAKLFVNYCLNCHSASSMRYNRLQRYRPERRPDQEQPAVYRATRWAT